MNIRLPAGEGVKGGYGAPLVLECAPAPRQSDVKEV